MCASQFPQTGDLGTPLGTPDRLLGTGTVRPEAGETQGRVVGGWGEEGGGGGGGVTRLIPVFGSRSSTRSCCDLVSDYLHLCLVPRQIRMAQETGEFLGVVSDLGYVCVCVCVCVCVFVCLCVCVCVCVCVRE